MSEAKHTQGPWVRSGESDIRGGDNFLVGMVNPIGSFREISKANARLIASAPDMLAALLNVQKLISEAAMTGFNCKDGDWAERLFHSQQKTSAAIAKAEGWS